MSIVAAVYTHNYTPNKLATIFTVAYLLRTIFLNHSHYKFRVVESLRYLQNKRNRNSRENSTCSLFELDFTSILELQGGMSQMNGHSDRRTREEQCLGLMLPNATRDIQVSNHAVLRYSF